MTGFQNILMKRSEDGDEDAYRLLMESLDYDEKTLPMFVAKYGEELDRVLDIPSLTEMVNADPESDAFKSVMGALKEYTELRNQGKAMHAPDALERLDIYGKKIPTVDDFMKAFGSSMEEGESEDDARAAFTNPENPRYWGNYSDSDKSLAAYQLGYRDFNDMYGDLNRASVGFQTRNRAEGFGPNNETNFYIPWAISALKGLAVPRIKEAQAAGRDVTWQDITGDMAELGLNFVPGVGIMGKGGKLLARIGPKSELLGKGIGMGLESFAVPALSQGMDAGLLYNPNTLGTAESGLNTRSEFSLPAMAAQAGGIAGAKGAIKGGASMVKNAMETTMGKQGGGNAFNKVFDSMERIGESTDDLIARRQAVLDRKAELAKKAENVERPNENRVTYAAVENRGYADPEAIYDAENLRILTDEANRFAKTQKLRKAYEEAGRNWDNMRQERRLNPASPEEQAVIGDWLDAGSNYNKAAVPERPFVQLPDGRFVYEQPGIVGGREWRGFKLADFRPGGDAEYYRIPPSGLKTMVEPGNRPNTLPRKYEMDFRNSGGPFISKTNFNIDRLGTGPEWKHDGLRNTYTQSVSEIAREPATLKAIQKDDLLSRKLDPYSTAKERARDVAGSAAFNAMSREGIVGNIDALNEGREKALWNRNLNRMREVITEPGIGPNERRRRQEAVMNVMAYGLDGLPEEVFSRDKAMYRAIAGRLGLRGWQHFSETSPQPSTSYSSAY